MFKCYQQSKWNTTLNWKLEFQKPRLVFFCKKSCIRESSCSKTMQDLLNTVVPERLSWKFLFVSFDFGSALKTLSLLRFFYVQIIWVNQRLILLSCSTRATRGLCSLLRRSCKIQIQDGRRTTSDRRRNCTPSISDQWTRRQWRW